MKDSSFDISILKHLPVAIGIADFEGNIMFINKTFTKLLGYTKDEIPTIEAWSKLAYPDPEYYQQAKENWDRDIKLTIETKENQEPHNYTIQCKDGSIKNVQISFSIEEDNILVFFKDITAIIKANDDTLKEKIFANNIINSLPGIFYIYRKQGEQFSLFRWNSTFEKISGYSCEELKGSSPFKFLSSEDGERARKTIQTVFSEGFGEADLEFISKDEKVTPYHFIAYPFVHNEETYFIGQGIDISKQRETESNLQTLFKALPDVIVVTDYEGNALFVNEQLTEQTGYTLSELRENKEKISLHTPEDKKMLQQKIQNLVNSSDPSTGIIENQLIDKKGLMHWYNGVIAKTTFNGEPALLTISRNINQIKNSEKALVESEYRMSAVFDSAPVIMMLINDKREILQINKKGIKSLNYNVQESNLIPFGDAYKCINSYKNPKGCGHSQLCGDCTIRKTIKDTFEKGNEHVKVEATIHSETQNYYILLSSSLLPSQNSNEVLLTIDDITERRRIEDDLKNSKEKAEESDRLKSAFLQNMSHEIRTPLNGVLGFSSLLDNDDLSSEDRKYYIEVINQSSGQLLSIVDDILSLSRLETGQIDVQNEEVNLNLIVQELFAKYSAKANEKNLVLSQNMELDDNQSCIFSDSDKIRQILDSLISNAIKFTSKGHVFFGYRLKNELLEFYVEDTGIGIEADFHNKIFERFQQVDLESTRIYGGTGLGLTIAKANTELIGGNIWLESESGNGSRFYFTVPYKPVYEELTSNVNSMSSEINTTDQITILVAEDEEINYLFIEESLKDLNFNLIHVYDGIEAVEQCKKNKDISIVLMDIKMPNMDGFTALKEIQNIRPELPVIAQTAYAMLSDKEKALNAGFKTYLSKPIKTKDLINAISDFLPK